MQIYKNIELKEQKQDRSFIPEKKIIWHEYVSKSNVRKTAGTK